MSRCTIISDPVIRSVSRTNSPLISASLVRVSLLHFYLLHIIFTIFTITACIFFYSLSISFWTQDLEHCGSWTIECFHLVRNSRIQFSHYCSLLVVIVVFVIYFLRLSSENKRLNFITIHLDCTHITLTTWPSSVKHCDAKLCSHNRIITTTTTVITIIIKFLVCLYKDHNCFTMQVQLQNNQHPESCEVK